MWLKSPDPNTNIYTDYHGIIHIILIFNKNVIQSIVNFIGVL